METLTIHEGIIKSIENIGDFVNLMILESKKGLEETFVLDYISKDFVGFRARIESRAVHSGLFCFFPRMIDQDIYLGENSEPIRVCAYSRDIRKQLDSS